MLLEKNKVHFLRYKNAMCTAELDNVYSSNCIQAPDVSRLQMYISTAQLLLSN